MTDSVNEKVAVKDFIVIKSKFPKNIDAFADLDFIISGMEKPLRLDRNILGRTSNMLASCLKAKKSLCDKSDDDAAHQVEWIDDAAASDEKYRNVLVKWLRFCYGEDQSFQWDECVTALVIFYKLELKKSEEVAQDIKKYILLVAKNDVVKGVKLVEECVDKYKILMDDIMNEGLESNEDDGEEEGKMSFCEQLVKTVMSKDNLDKQFEIVRDCMMKLPHGYFVNNEKRRVIEFGDEHSERSEFRMRVNYIKFNESLDANVKVEIVKKCDVSKLESDELKELEELQILGVEEMMELYRRTLKSKEEENKEMKKKIEELTRILEQPLIKRIVEEEKKKKEEEVKKIKELVPIEPKDDAEDAEAMKKGEELLNRKPEMKTQTSLGSWDPWKPWKLESQDLEAFCMLLKRNMIPTKTLNLGGNKIGDEEAKKISESLMMNTTLTALGLGWNHIGEEGAKKISESLMKNTTLTRLSLWGNKIGAEGAKKISESLMKNTTLTELDLNTNKIGEEGATKISESLMKNTTLTTLGLGNNSIGNEGAKKISESLMKNTTLTELNLYRNNIRDEGAKKISESLMKNTTLRELYLGENHIGEEGATKISESLMKNTTLTRMWLHENHIGEEGATKISESLMMNTTLTTLYLYGNRIGDEGAKKISESLMKNTTLTKLDLESNNIGDEGRQSLKRAWGSRKGYLHL